MKTQMLRDIVLQTRNWADKNSSDDIHLHERDLRTTNLILEAIFESLPLSQKMAVKAFIEKKLEDESLR